MANFRVWVRGGFSAYTGVGVVYTAYISTTARILQINNNNNNMNFRHRSNFWFVARPSVVGDYVTEILHKFFLCCSVNVFQLHCVCKIGTSRLQYASLSFSRLFSHKFTNNGVDQVVIFVETIYCRICR